MSFLQFNAPPLPYYIASGEDTYQPGDRHPSRRNIGVFDLLVVTCGRLFISEELDEWTVESGQAVVLRPDKHHFSSKPCQEMTHFYWLHFQSSGEWFEIREPSAQFTPHRSTQLLAEDSQSVRTALPEVEDTITPYGRLSSFLMKLYPIRIARHGSLAHSALTLKNLCSIMDLERQPQPSARWKQQLLFQEVFQDLHTTQTQSDETTALQLAEEAARFLRENYRSEITYESLRNSLNFHPTYIARCMRRVFDCAPQEYLIRYRIEQAKLLLINSDMPIQEVANDVGFRHFSYFSRSFVKIEGVTPRLFRKRYRT